MSQAATFLLTGFNRSGGVRILTEVINLLADNGWQVTVLTDARYGAPFYPLHARVKSVQLTSKSRLKYLIDLAVYRYEAVFIVSSNYRTSLALGVAQLFRRTGGARIFQLLQHYDPLQFGMLDYRLPFWMRWIHSLIIRIAFYLPHEQIAVSQWIINKIGLKRVKLISNGINAHVFNAKGSLGRQYAKKLKVGVNLRKNPLKCWDETNEVLANLSVMDGIEVRAMGDAPLMDIPYVYPKNDQEIADFYKGCDVFVFLSLAEGFGLPPLEAMACGCVVVLNDAGGTREFAIDQKNAVLVPLDPSRVIFEIQQLLANQDRFESLRQAAILTGQSFSDILMKQRYLDYFNS